MAEFVLGTVTPVEICTGPCLITQKFGLVELTIDPLGSPITFTLDKTFEHLDNVPVEAKALLPLQATVITSPITGVGGVADLKVPSVIKLVTSFLLLSDLQQIGRWQNSADVIFTIPVEATLAVPIDSWMQFYRTTVNEVSIVPEGGVTFEGALGNVGFKLEGQQGFISIILKTDTNRWLYAGAIKAL